MGNSKTTKSSQKKEAIIAFVKEHGRRPRKRNPEEKNLWEALRHYTQPSSVSYDSDFSRLLEDLVPAIIQNPESKKIEILTFVKEHGRRPTPKKPEERKLAWSTSRYSRPNDNGYDPEFVQKLKDLLPKKVQSSASLNKESILAFVKEHGRRPSRTKPDEKKLANGAYNYTHPSNESYDPDFALLLNELVPKTDTVSLKKEAILAFVKEHGRRPSRVNPEEKKLGFAAESYTSPSGGSYDPEFARLLNELVPIIDTASLNKEAVINFIKKFGRRPLTTKSEEKNLGQAVSRYTSPNSDSYDPVFTNLLNGLAPKVDTASLKKEAVLAFAKENGRRPVRTKPEEKILGQATSRYTSPNSESYDPEFTRQLNEFAPDSTKKFNPGLKKEAILAFIKIHGRRPVESRPDEKRLRESSNSYTSPTSGSYDEEFAKLVNELIPRIDTVAINKKKILSFVKTHGRRPSRKKAIEKSLGSAACNYTNPNHRSYDQEFARKLDKLAPKTIRPKKEAAQACVREHGLKTA